MPSCSPYRNEVTQARLLELFRYNKQTGSFTRRIAMGNYRAGSKAGSSSKDGGYVIVIVDGVAYRAHRLAFLYVTGKFPVGDVDHRDKIRTNNRWKNIRPATFSQNRFNSTKRSDNSTGYTGVCKFRNRFQASIAIQGKRIYLGTFETAEAAAKVYAKKAKELYGKFAVIGEQSAFVMNVQGKN